jgi:hypothetical protein
MFRKGHWGVKEEAVQQETREATMAKRMMILVVVGVVRFMVVWLEI